MRSILVERNGRVTRAEAVEPTWLADDAAERVWVDIEAPTDEDRALLIDVFAIHELAVVNDTPVAVMETSGSSYCVSRIVWSRAVKAKNPTTRISGTIV